MSNSLFRANPLEQLKKLSSARVGLQRVGSSVATSDVLKFDLDHARARDAVHLPYDTAMIAAELDKRCIEHIQVDSGAADRGTYLQRPDLGRALSDASKTFLQRYNQGLKRQFDLGIFIADGLSTRAIHSNALPFIDEFLPIAARRGWSCSPLVLVNQGRVAIADEIGEILKTRLSIILIGERPGLTASDSMGIYITYEPRHGRSDAERNCLSNVRDGGLSIAEAARKLEGLIEGSFILGLSGVALKEGEELLVDKMLFDQ